MGKQNHQIEYVHICIYGMYTVTDIWWWKFLNNGSPCVVVPVLSTRVSSNDSASPRWGTSTGGTLVVVVSYVTTVAFSESKHPSALIRAISLNRYKKMTHLPMATFRTICSLTVRYFLNSILEWLFDGSPGISFCNRLFLGQFSQQCVISVPAEKDSFVHFSPAGWARSNEQRYIGAINANNMPSQKNTHPIRPTTTLAGWRVVRFR